MHIKWLTSNRKLLCLPRRVIALILLALLTMVSVPVLSKERGSGVSEAKQPATQHSSQISQPTNGSHLSMQGEKLYKAGQFSEAASIWQQAASAYERVGDEGGAAKSRINIAEAVQALGLYPRACNTLLQAFGIAFSDCRKLTQENENRQQRDSLLKTLKAQPNSLTKAIGLCSLGKVLQKLDNLELSRQVLQLSLSAAKALPSPQAESAALVSLGNTELALGNRARAKQYTVTSEQSHFPWRCPYTPTLGAPERFYQQATKLYQQAATESALPTTWVEAQVNRLSVLLQLDALSDAQDLWPRIQFKLKDLPASRTAIYAQMNLAQSLNCLKQANAAAAPSWREIAQALATSAKQARTLGDQGAESYALGYLGGLYAQTEQSGAQDLNYAKDLTQQALSLAQAAKATEISYQWQWQLGYLLRMQGDIQGAIANYTAAVNTLQSIRSDLVAASTNAQFSFREGVEPVYRQLVDLLLQSDQTSQTNLKQAREQIEALHLAELENLLRCNLQAASPVPIEHEGDPQAAVIYPIILDDRIEVILSLYGQPLRHYSKPLPKKQNIESLLDTLRENLQNPDTIGASFLELSQQVYDWLIRPVETDLEKSRVKTLVFVLDSPLRNIPMAALHDGQHYLIEKYAIALSPSLQLLKPKPLSGKHFEVLAAGISQKIPGFPAPALPEVKDELDRISKLPKSLVLRNQEFTRSDIQNKINEHPFSVVHLATHGQFSSNPDQTYIRAWDVRLDINQLKTLLESREQRRPDAIELLVLSACETAEGDKRATLGLAGMAVRAGARSTLATLWQVNDNSTAELMTQFYKTLSNPADSTMTKAKALQIAQLALLHRDAAPLHWASYVLVGNWL